MSKQKIGKGMKVGNLYFITLTATAAGVTPEWGVDRQIRAILDLLKKNLEEAGSSMENVVKATVYLVNLDDRERHLNPIWEQYFGRAEERKPVRCAVQVWLAPPLMVEMEFIAYIPE